MEQYIKKSTLVAKIEELDEFWHLSKSAGGQAFIESLLSFLDTLEVKEVDLEKEVDSQTDLLCNLLCYMDELSNGDSEGVYPLPGNVIEDLQRFAKYFFELGLKAKGE